MTLGWRTPPEQADGDARGGGCSRGQEGTAHLPQLPSCEVPLGSRSHVGPQGLHCSPDLPGDVCHQARRGSPQMRPLEGGVGGRGSPQKGLTAKLLFIAKCLRANAGGVSGLVLLKCYGRASRLIGEGEILSLMLVSFSHGICPTIFQKFHEAFLLGPDSPKDLDITVFCRVYCTLFVREK